MVHTVVLYDIFDVEKDPRGLSRTGLEKLLRTTFKGSEQLLESVLTDVEQRPLAPVTRQFSLQLIVRRISLSPL